MASRTSLPPETPNIDGAIALLESDDHQVRQFVAYLLGQVRDPRAVDPLIQTLHDPHVGVRGAAANALGNLRAKRALPYLRPLLKDPNPQLIVWVAFALTMLGDDQFDLIVRALQSDDVDVRRSGVLAMRQLGDPRAIEPLRQLRGDHARRFETDTTVEAAATNALFSLGYDGAL